MGKIRQGILDGVSGKVGNVVGASWMGIDYIRIMPDHVANPRTELQVNQREKFKGVTALAKKLIGSVIHPIWDRTAVRMTGINLFVRKNIDAFGIDGTIEDYSKLNFSAGPLPLPEDISVIADSKVESGIKISWDNVSEEGNKTDKLMLVAVNSENNKVRTMRDLPFTRGEGSADVVLPFEARSDVHVYVFFGDTKKRRISPSVHTALTI